VNEVNTSKKLNKDRRHRRVRASISGTKERPRVSIFRSNKHIFVQFIDDDSGRTILSSKIFSASKTKIKGDKTDKAVEVGKIIAEKAKEAGISQVVFDRGGYRYHGRVKALADSLRAGGLKL